MAGFSQSVLVLLLLSVDVLGLLDKALQHSHSEARNVASGVGCKRSLGVLMFVFRTKPFKSAGQSQRIFYYV